MLKRSFLLTALLAAVAGAQAQVQVGKPAPALQVKDAQGETVSLADFKGKTVVLEWVNPGCPFVRKHYGAQNMQGTQKAALAQGAVWLSISSTAPSSGDYKKPAELSAWLQGQGATPSALLMDDEGTAGKAWGAKTTPHMYIVNPAGVLVYAGAIDSIPSANPADIPKATNFVTQALGELKAGQPISKPATTPYGCSVKYS
ncbi:redoxin domain-containing protein [Inhella proteolytica]|uniref:Redoxin domain-containing protein n=1 Tax=Inhella proteolytica TaxID=2795029 RepID=A0A931J4C7_9BURK|nr:redoxin domain-containing protein [Inhella proteolytica]MBH9579381.1 redoxin domain-containing protein [Inhella proteolytica]